MSCVLLATVLAILTNAADIASAIRNKVEQAPFSIQAEVTYVSRFGEPTIAVKDGSGAAILVLGRDRDAVPEPSVGDHVILTGKTESTFPRIAVACCHKGRIIGHKEAPAPADVTSKDFLAGVCDNRLIRIRGTTTETFSDEISQGWQYLVLNQDGNTFYAAYPKPKDDNPQIALGSEVVITGVCDPFNLGLRRLLGRILVASSSSDVTILQHPLDDPFNVPLLDDSPAATPQEVVARGRVKVSGHVLAVREGRIILKNGTGGIVNVELTEGPFPQTGEHVDVVGQTETDLYRVNLSHAIWRPSSHHPIQPPEKPQDITAADLFWNRRRQRELQVVHHGRLVRLRGIVEHLATFENGRALLHLASGDEILKAEIPPSDTLSDGLLPKAEIELTGICAMDTENWRQGGPFPHIRNVTIVARQADDIRILAPPPWWTPARFLSALGILLLILVGLAIWNRGLRLLVNRKSRQLLREQVAKIESELRTDERTRLAAELHDNLAQNLTAITYQVSAALRARQRDPAASENHLTTAARMLDSCRTELRRCLWDLRSEALDEKDFSQAIRLSVTPVLANASVAIRFNVPRSRLRDSTAQSVLSMLRELVSNAVRHGQASQIRIAGELNDGSLRFSIRDNGCGFDPGRCGTAADGHFGLDGIRERVNRHGGRIEIASTRGMGTRILVSLPLHQPAPTDEKTK